MFLLPSARNFRFEGNRLVHFQLSLNDGVDYTTDNIAYTFYDEPQMTKLSKTNANLMGNIPLIIYGINFRPDITYCLFGSQKVLVTSVTPTTVQCMVPPSA